MAIKNTELVALNGSTSGFGGRIYSANYQIGFNQSPSTLTLSFFNESGNYNISQNDLRTTGAPDIIQIGNRTLSMYPVETSYERSDSGKILSVEYHDTSIVFLDKKFVLLIGTHTNDSSNSPSSAVIRVGRKYYSETIEVNGVSVENKTQTPPNSIDLGQSLYTVSELHQAMVSHNIPMNQNVGNVLLNKKGATDYFNNIVGTLRDVLLAWGNIMAFSFYWSESGQLNIIDLESDLDVNMSKLQGIRLFSDEEVFSLKETVDRGYSMYYGKPGRITSSERPPRRTNKSFGRGIRQLDNAAETGLTGLPLSFNFIKASLLGEGFFNLYVLYKSIDNENVRNAFGIEDFENLSEDSDKRKFVDPDKEFPSNQFGMVRYRIKENAQFGFGFIRDLVDKVLTYETTLVIDDFERFNAWSRPFTYDIENETAFINNSNQTGSVGNFNHRAFFRVPDDEGFDLQNVNIPNDLVTALRFESSFGKPLPSLGINTAEDIILAFRLISQNYDNIIDSITYRYLNRQFLPNIGFAIQPTAIEVTSRSEFIFNQNPSLTSNVMKVDMQLDTASDNEIVFAGSLGNLTNILNSSYKRDKPSFRKRFSISGISTPQKIEISDGLQSISITNTNERGTVSSYEVGNTMFRIPSKEIILQKLEREKFAVVKSQQRDSFVFSRGGFNV